MFEYVEREALLKKMETIYPLIQSIYLPKVIEKFVKEAPAADVAPVVHGRWILRNTCGPNTEKYHCSVCDKIPRSLCPEIFCPNCGARMDGEAK